MNGNPKTTMLDIAHQAGVSVSSVSRVLADSQPVSEDLRIKVMEAAENLGYETKPSVSSGSPGTIGLFQSTIRNHIGDEIVEGIRGHAAQFGWEVVLVEMSANQIQLGSKAEQLLGKAKIDGLILLETTQPDEYIRQLSRQRQIPIVSINRNYDIPGVRCVHVDYETSAYNATRHLLNLKHRHFGFLSAPPAYITVVEREAGMERALREEGLHLREEDIAMGQATPDGGYIAMNHLLEANRPNFPTALLVHNDLMAIGALHALRDWNLRVPEDMSVIAFYDSEFVKHTDPPITVIAPPLRHLGLLAATKLIEMIDNESNRNSTSRTMIQSTLLHRDSVAAPSTS